MFFTMTIPKWVNISKNPHNGFFDKSFQFCYNRVPSVFYNPLNICFLAQVSDKSPSIDRFPFIDLSYEIVPFVG